MKRLLIFSDSHGHINDCLKIIENSEHIDAVIHAGDYTRDAADIQSVFPDIPMYYVKGNNDFFSNAPGELTFIIGGARIFLTHGHDYRVKYESNYRTLVSRAKKAEADLCIFGHTHIAHTSLEGNMTLLNPGSIRFGKTYATARIENGKVYTSVLEYK